MEWLKLFAISRLAENEGATSQRATTIGLIAAMIPGNLGMLVGIAAARNEAPPPPAETTTSKKGVQTAG